MSDLKTEDMTVSQLQDYHAAKRATDAIGKVPFAGDTALAVAKVGCDVNDYLNAGIDALHLLPRRHEPVTCQAVKDTLGELNAPAFPKTSEASVKSPNR